MAIDPIQLTRSLVDIESITYNEGEVGVWLEKYLNSQGLAVDRMPVPQPSDSRYTGERFNIYSSTIGIMDMDGPEIVLSTHMDTVPPFVPSSEDNEYIYGRGSCDAKGIIAAQIAAADRLIDMGIRAALLFVVGEERDSAGAKLANLNPKGSRFLINGEPTDNRLALASKGALRATIRASGKMGHSAYPELGDSAIHKLVHALERVLALRLPFVEDVGPGTLNVGVIEGGHAPNVIADTAAAHVLVRLVGPSEEVRAAIEEAVSGIATVEFTLDIPFIRMRKIEGLETMVAAFTTDIPALSNWGEPLLLGPGSIHVAHTPHERLAKKELFEAVDLYTQVALRLLQQA
jgi:acetylornithine deacetylase